MLSVQNEINRNPSTYFLHKKRSYTTETQMIVLTILYTSGSQIKYNECYFIV